MTWSRVVNWIIKNGEFVDIRGDIVDIYIAAYHKMPTAQEQFDGLSDEYIREVGREHGRRARNYDPSERIKDIEDYSNSIWKVIQVVLAVPILISVLTGGGSLLLASQEALRWLDAVFNPLLTFISWGSAPVAAITAALLLCIRILTASGTFVNRVNKELVFTNAMFETRFREQLAGRALWNRSLNGGSAIQLLAVFSFFKLLSTIPGWNPYEYVVDLVKDNIDAFSNDDGYIDAIQKLYDRLRSDYVDETNDGDEAERA